MTKLFTFLLALSLHATLIACHQHKYSTCSIQGITHVRGFMSNNLVESCYHYGSKILFENPMVKVSSHSYMNETTMKVDWHSTKVFVEFYGDIQGLPIALFTSDLLTCPCAAPCLATRTSQRTMGLGVDGAVDVVVRQDTTESTVAYLNYKRANISIYVRKTNEGFNFGIQVPEHFSMRSSGVCVTGCSRVVNESTIECLKNEYIQPAVDICKQVFMDLQSANTSDEDFMQIRIKPCARDVFMWRNASAALSHRYAYIDELLLSNYSTYSTIIASYNEAVGKFAFNSSQYDTIVDQMVRTCVDNESPVEDTLTFTRVDSMSSGIVLNNKNKTASGRMSILDLSGADKTQTHEESFLPVNIDPSVNTGNDSVTNSSSIRVDLSNDRFIDVSGMDLTTQTGLEITEWRVKCQRQRTTKLGVFYLAYPMNQSIFVQCDETNRAFLRQCPIGTIFTVRMVCELMTTTTTPIMTMMPDDGTKVQQLQAPKLNELFKGKSPLQIQIATTTIASLTIVNPCSNSTRAQGLFFFPHPTDSTMFIQCDDFNNMILVKCVIGTKFSADTRSCQKF